MLTGLIAAAGVIVAAAFGAVGVIAKARIDSRQSDTAGVFSAQREAVEMLRRELVAERAARDAAELKTLMLLDHVRAWQVWVEAGALPPPPTFPKAFYEGSGKHAE